MTTFLQKLRVITLGTAHDLLDKAIDLNSPSALRQYVRDLEDALDRLQNEAAVAAGQIRTLTREAADLQRKIETGTAAATVCNSRGQTELTRAKASEVIRAKEALVRNADQLETQRKTSEGLDAAVAKLNAKHVDMVSRVQELERMDRDSKAKEQAASSLAKAGKLVSGGSGISIDDIQTKMQARNDVASEKFDRAIGSVDTQEDPEHTAAVDDFLASLTPAKTAANG